MPSNWLVRLKAGVLAVLLLSGGGGMPLLDLALFHASASSHCSNPHFESANGVDGHGDYCKQGTALPHAPGAVRLDPAVRAVATTVLARHGAPDSALPSADLGLLPRPRAPPAFRA